MRKVISSMGGVERDPVSVAEAARLLGTTIAQAYDLVFTRQLRSVEAPSGRRLVPRAAIDAWKAAHASVS
jgi:excisionase family DNA binding protein